MGNQLLHLHFDLNKNHTYQKEKKKRKRKNHLAKIGAILFPIQHKKEAVVKFCWNLAFLLLASSFPITMTRFLMVINSFCVSVSHHMPSLWSSRDSLSLSSSPSSFSWIDYWTLSVKSHSSKSTPFHALSSPFPLTPFPNTSSSFWLSLPPLFSLSSSHSTFYFIFTSAQFFNPLNLLLSLYVSFQSWAVFSPKPFIFLPLMMTLPHLSPNQIQVCFYVFEFMNLCFYYFFICWFVGLF